MSKYTYSPLSDPDQIRVFILQPSRDRTAPLRGVLRKIRLKTPHLVTVNASQPGNVQPGHVASYGDKVSWTSSSWMDAQWEWKFGTEIKVSKRITVDEEGRVKQWNETEEIPTFQCVRRDYLGTDSYDALSYTWGSPEKLYGLEIGNRSLPIGDNLQEALSMFRDADSARTTWVDAICINQDDVNERNHQVHIMENIYSQAASVVVWLGSESQSSRAAMDLIIDCNRPDGAKLLDHKKSALRGLSDLFFRTWWKRIWIVQEAVAGRELVILCGRHILPWNFVSRVCREIRREEFSQNGKSQLLRTSGYRNFTALSDFRREHGTMSLTKYLKCTKDYEASDMRDKLYALIGVASDISLEDIVPDYTKSTRTVFLDLVHFLVTRRRSLDVISSGRHLRLAPTAHPGSQLQSDDKTPSWLPEWRVSQGLRPLDSEGVDGVSYRASGDTNAVVRMDAFPLALEVEGIVVDKIDFFGGTINSTAQDSLTTLRRWQYIASQHLISGSHTGAETPPGFWTTIVAGKNYRSAWGLELPAKSSKALETGAQAFVAGNTSQQAWITKYFADAVTRAVMGRRFFITVKKRMGLGVPEIQLKDRVVVLKGCSVPLILRDVGDHMVIVGESYVSGIMDGEVIEGLAAGKYKTRMIRLQ